MPKTIKHFILKTLIVTVFVSVLVVFDLDWSEPVYSEAVFTEGYGDLTCDEFIPIGNALDGVMYILFGNKNDPNDDGAFGIYQGENMKLAMDNIIGVVGALTLENNVCDFKKCISLVGNQGPELGIQFDAFFWQGSLKFKIPPWCVPQGGIGEPCPDISPFLEGDDKNIMGLRTLRESFMTNAEMLHSIFEDPTERLPMDLAKYLQDEDGNLIDEDGNLLSDGDNAVFDIKPGEEITKADLALRMAEQVELQLTPGTYKSCALSTLQRELVADGRIGNVFPMQCKQAYEAGLYQPRQWSMECAKECEGGSEKNCMECLKDDQGDSASQLAQINYRIYGKCRKECGTEDPSDPGNWKWEMTQECQKCLCSRRAKPVAGSGGITGGAEIAPSSEEDWEKCLAWLCGGSVSNWVCCHETSLEGLPERPEIAPFTL